MDITKCHGTNCPNRNTCTRYTAPDSALLQSWFTTPPLEADGTCTMYWGTNQVNIIDMIEEITKGESK